MGGTGEGSPKEAKWGCLAVLVAAAMLQGGVVILAVALHRILGPESAASPWPLALCLALSGVGGILVLAAPRMMLALAGTRPEVGWSGAAAAIPDFAVAGAYLAAWASPETVGVGTAKLLVGAMLLEFIVIHASLMLVAGPVSGAWKKSPRAAVAGMLVLYSLVAAGISASMRTHWLFVGFWTLMANKFVGDVFTPHAAMEERRRRHMARWGISAVLYLVLAFGTVILPVPRLGVDFELEGGGLWMEHPNRVLAMGALYFVSLGLCELFGRGERDGVPGPGPHPAPTPG